jgi:hypothetical protein
MTSKPFSKSAEVTCSPVRNDISLSWDFPPYINATLVLIASVQAKAADDPLSVACTPFLMRLV